MNFKVTAALFFLVAGCAAAASSTDAGFEVSLESRHTSVFNKIRYRIPKGWVVVDGESDWVAPSDDKQFWAPGFDRESDAYYVVSAVFPYLTMQDMTEKRGRSLDEVVTATVHSLTVAADATTIEAPRYFSVGGNDAASFTANMAGTHVHHQVFVRLVDGTVATVAGNGPRDQLNSIRALVTAIAATVEPGIKK